MEKPIVNLTEQDLSNRIDDILQANLYIQDVPYSFEDGAKEICYASREAAATAIVDYLKENNLVNLSNEVVLPLSKIKELAVEFAKEWQAGNIITQQGVDNWFENKVK